jgi:hypothetical protein
VVNQDWPEGVSLFVFSILVFGCEIVKKNGIGQILDPTYYL